MEAITELFEKQLTSTLRNECYVRVTFATSNPNAPLSSIIKDNNSVVFSQSDNVDFGFNINRTYQTLEAGRFVLNGKNELYDESLQRFTGYTSYYISDSNGSFTTPPKITIEFGGKKFDFSGWTMSFDQSMNNYPTDFLMECFNEGASVYSKTYNPTSPLFSTQDILPTCDKIELTFNKTNVPHRRVRVSSIIYGLANTFDDKQVLNCELTNEVDIMSNDLPVTKFDFTIFDIENKYNPDNPNNIIQYLENGQNVKYELGWKLDDDTIEWLPMYTGYTSESVNFENSGEVKTASFNTVSILNTLDTIFNGQSWTGNAVTMYDLALMLVNYIGYNGILILPTELKSFSTKALLNGFNIKTGLQLIANACGFSIYTNRNGLIMFQDMSKKTDVAFSFTDRSMLEHPDTNRIPQVRVIKTKYYTYRVKSDIQEIATIDIYNDKATEYFAEYENYANVTYEASSGLTVSGTPTITATRFSGTFTGRGTVTIKGQEIEKTENTISKVVNDSGVDLEISNELIDSYENANAYIERVLKYYERRSDYKFENRGYPNIDVGDTVTVTTNYSTDKEGTLYYNKITYNGAISAESKILEFKE